MPFESRRVSTPRPAAAILLNANSYDLAGMARLLATVHFDILQFIES